MADTKIYYKYSAPGKLYFRRTSASGYTEVTLTDNSNDFYIWNGPYDSESVIVPEYVYIEEEIYPIFLTNFFREMAPLKNIYNIENLKTGECTKMDYMFRGSLYLTSLDLSNFDTSNVTTMKNMFYGCSALTSLDLSSFNTSNVTNMEGMFLGCRSLTSLDISGFNTSNVTTMRQMFSNCSALTSLDLSGFNTSNVKDMSYMFTSSTSLISLDVTGFDDTHNVTNMSYMFSGCKSLTSLDVSEFNTSNVRNMSYMFDNCNSLTSLDLSGFDTSNVTYMENMFTNCRLLTSLDVSEFNTSNATNMSYMFNNCNLLASLNLSSFDTSNVTTMKNMFCECDSLTSLDLSNFDTSNVTDMSFMFDGCDSLTFLDVTSFDTSNVTTMLSMFRNCSSLASLDVSNFNLPSTGNISYMFGGNFLGQNIYFPLGIRNENDKLFFSVNNNQHYLCNKGSSATTSVVNFWKNIASEYSNVHYEYDDNPLPVVSNLSVTRVASSGSRTFDTEGLYGYLSFSAALYSTYLPVGYTNELVINALVDNSSISGITLNSSTNLYEGWVQLNNTDGHNFTVSVSDSIKVNNVQIALRAGNSLSYSLSKIFTLVDYYHESNSSDPNYNKEGIAFGKYATNANLFDVDMPSRFRDSIVIDRLVGEIKMYSGLVIPTGWLLCDGSEVLIEDYPLLNNALGGDSSNDIAATLWGTASNSNSFVLPNFVGRMPLGASDINTTEWVTITGENEFSTFTLAAPTYARWGTGDTWLYKILEPGDYSPTYTNMNELFGGDPASGVAKCIQVALNVASNGGYSWWRPTTADMPIHTHSQPNHTHFSGLYTVPDRFGSGSRDAAGAYTGYSGQVAINTGNASTVAINNSGGGRYISQMPPFAVVNYIICAV